MKPPGSFRTIAITKASPPAPRPCAAPSIPSISITTVGKLEILKLRDDYKKQEGGNFSLQKFHDEMLRHGMPPIRLLREIMLKDRAAWDQVL